MFSSDINIGKFENGLNQVFVSLTLNVPKAVATLLTHPKPLLFLIKPGYAVIIQL